MHHTPPRTYGRTATRRSQRPSCLLASVFALGAWGITLTSHAQAPYDTPEPAVTPTPMPTPTLELAPEMPPDVVAPAAVTPPVVPPPAAPRNPWTFEPSAQVRVRGEARVNGYTPTVRDDEYFVTSRIRVGLRASWTRLRLFAQAQDVRNLGDSFPGSDGGAGFGIHQGYAEVDFDHGYVRIGRQEVNYGTERFLGALDWLSSARSFDAARVHLTPTAKLEFDAFAAITRSENVFLVNATDRATSAGDYFAASQLAYTPSPGLRLEANYFYRHDSATTALPLRSRDIHAPTIRASGNYHDGQLRYDVEGTVQTGQTNLGRHFAYAFAGDVTARMGGAGRPFVDGGASYATGRSSSGRVDELENFFPTNHKFYGFMDLFGLRNIIEGHVGVSHRFTHPNLTVAARGFGFFEQTTNATARWSTATGTTIAAGQGGGSRYIGAEADFWASYKPLDFLSINGGYSVFVPGSAASAMGHDDTQHWFWLQVDVFTP